MSPTGIGLIAFVVLLSGLLAYYGDVFGRKLGKKRLTVGRLRPRHTAAMMTALFGMLGSGAAIGILVFLAQPVRVMLLEGDKLKSEISGLKSDLQKRQDELDKTKREVSVEKGLFSEEHVRLLTEQNNVSELKNLTQKLKEQADRSRNDLSKVRQQLSTLRPQFEKLKSDFGQLQTQKTTAIKYYDEVSKKNLELDQQLLESDRKLQKNKRDIEELNGTIIQLQKELLSQSTEANKQLMDLKKQVDEAKDKVDAANKELTAANNEYAQLKAGIEQLLSAATAVSRTQPLIISRGDELARVTARSKLNGAEARAYLLAALQNASSEALSRGAQPSSPGGEAAVLPPLRDDKGNNIGLEAQLESLIQRLSGKNEDQVILAYAFFNAFKGEPVPLSVQIRPNPVVYHAGQVIAETKVDGQMSEDQILNAISQFAQDNLAPKAVKDGLIPAVGKKEPLGEIASDVLLSLVKDIKAVNRVIRVQFIAVQDTRAADRLKLRFLLK